MQKGRQGKFSFKSFIAGLTISKGRAKAPGNSTPTPGASKGTGAVLGSSQGTSDTDENSPPNPGAAISVGPQASGSGSGGSGTALVTPTPNVEHDIANPTVQPGNGTVNFFPNANQFHLEHFTYLSPPAPQSNLESSEGWKLLLQHTAPNALYDSSARFDPPKCDPDTRTDVLDEIMGWIEDPVGLTRLLCLTGAAGAGKSALQQTIAERCSNKKILAAAFFFSASDYTRNNLSKVVPTMAYQIAQEDARFRTALSESVEQDPLIFDKSLITQFDSLIVKPWAAVYGVGEATRPSPQVVLLDGLDECLDTQRQGELLTAIRDVLLSNPHLSLRIFLSSRPEWPIRTALDPQATSTTWLTTFV